MAEVELQDGAPESPDPRHRRADGRGTPGGQRGDQGRIGHGHGCRGVPVRLRLGRHAGAHAGGTQQERGSSRHAQGRGAALAGEGGRDRRHQGAAFLLRHAHGRRQTDTDRAEGHRPPDGRAGGRGTHRAPADVRRALRDQEQRERRSGRTEAAHSARGRRPRRDAGGPCSPGTRSLLRGRGATHPARQRGSARDGPLPPLRAEVRRQPREHVDSHARRTRGAVRLRRRLRDRTGLQRHQAHGRPDGRLRGVERRPERRRAPAHHRPGDRRVPARPPEPLPRRHLRTIRQFQGRGVCRSN